MEKVTTIKILRKAIKTQRKMENEQPLIAKMFEKKIIKQLKKYHNEKTNKKTQI
nr:MAG: hypothetical protein [Microvirus sp.]